MANEPTRGVVVTRPRHSIIVITIALVIGAWQFGQGIYIYAKAELAQYLLVSAWEESKQTQRPVKPWSWADTWPVARLSVPAHDVDLIVLAGDTGRTLAFGPGHHLASVKPGDIGNSIISAHRDTHFEFLQDLSAGDKIIVENQNGVKKVFTVSNTHVVDSRDAHIPVDYENAALTLVTCFPFNSITTGGPLRFVVVAVESEKSSQGQFV
ncbi:class GN sortase [Kaarinaea lacus]